ncbi:MAG: TnpV protein, partial [Alkaliphilus sp.]
YGIKAMNYLKEEHPNRYNFLLTEGILMEKMHQADKEAWEKMQLLRSQLLKEEPVPNPQDTYQSFRHREMIRIRAEEVVMREVVYKVR